MSISYFSFSYVVGNFCVNSDRTLKLNEGKKNLYIQ